MSFISRSRWMIAHFFSYSLFSLKINYVAGIDLKQSTKSFILAMTRNINVLERRMITFRFVNTNLEEVCHIWTLNFSAVHENDKVQCKKEVRPKTTANIPRYLYESSQFLPTTRNAKYSKSSLWERKTLGIKLSSVYQMPYCLDSLIIFLRFFVCF